MSELSCDTPFIGRNETHDLSRYLVNILPFDLNHREMLSNTLHFR